jgi:hypothetical protein
VILAQGAPSASSKPARWAGTVLGALVVLQLLFSATMKLARPSGVPEHFAELGWRMRDVTVLAFLELACTGLYVVPRTRKAGAILLTGYLGGAVATHVRIGDGVFAYPLLLGVALWAAPYLRGELAK